MTADDDFAVGSVYGMPLNDLVLDENNIPTFLPVVCDYIKRFAATEGVFRRSGENTFTDKLGYIFNWKECAIPPVATVHDITNFLTRWLSRLPGRLVDLTILQDRYDPNDESTAIDFLRSLPVINRRSLAVVFSMLIEVLEQQETLPEHLRMSPDSLNTCITPCFRAADSGGFPLVRLLAHTRQYLSEDSTDFVLP